MLKPEEEKNSERESEDEERNTRNEADMYIISKNIPTKKEMLNSSIRPKVILTLENKERKRNNIWDC